MAKADVKAIKAEIKELKKQTTTLEKENRKLQKQIEKNKKAIDNLSNKSTRLTLSCQWHKIDAKLPTTDITKE